MSSHDLPGVSAMSLYVPPFRVDLKDWCSWTDNSWEKISAVVGRSYAKPDPAPGASFRVVVRP